MVIVNCGVRPDGKPCEFYMHKQLHAALEEVKQVVGTTEYKGKDWDYVAIVAGNPGVGKSNFAQNCARFCCDWFNEDYIAFTADEFIEITNDCPKNSAVVLDESFASLNTGVSRSSDFLKIINHLQLIRQKNLYIFLCLPNFFDLAKGISIYRSHHLFVCYSQKFGDRGTFAAYGRSKKRLLYIKGKTFMDYAIEMPNFRGDFRESKCIDHEKYESRKAEHLRLQDNIETSNSKSDIVKEKLISYLKDELNYTAEQIAEISGVHRATIYRIIARNRQKSRIAVAFKQ